MLMSKSDNALNVRPLPWKCGECGERQVYLDRFPYSWEVAHDGQTYQVELPDLETLRCRNCGAVVITEEADREVDTAFRRQAGLLAPDQIREKREGLGLSLEELAKHLGVAETMLSRWETGVQIQPMALNHLLELFFQFRDVRSIWDARMR